MDTRVTASYTSSTGKPFLGPEYAIGSTRLKKLSQTQTSIRDEILAADSPEDYENVPCLCGSAGPDVLLATVERHGLPCRNVVCQACGLIRISPRWKNARYHAFYENQYRDLYNVVLESKAEFARKTAGSTWIRGIGAWIEASLARHRPGNSMPHVLEIGTGGGWNISNLPTGWQRTGYDVDDQYLQIGEEIFGLRMKHGLITEALTDVRLADAVLLSHVVEHLPDPVASLRSIANHLRPGALLLIEVPGIFRLHWTARDPMVFLQNAHVFTFCAKTLESVCIDAGLRVLEQDEICRVVCVRDDSQKSSHPDDRLAARILRYYRACEAGATFQHRLRAIPIIGRVPATVWKKLYFPWLRLLTPGQP